jgi:hypothetical protein
MARKITPRPWLPFQKRDPNVKDHHARSSAPNSVLVEETEAPSTPKRSRRRSASTAAQKGSTRSSTTADRLRPWAAAWKWQLICLAMLTAVGGTAVGALIWLSKAPPAVDCKKISAWATDSERLFCAQEAASTGKPEEILNAISLVKNWTAENPLYGQAQQLLEDWSNALLILARDRIAQRDINGAVALANQIPATSPTYKDAQAAIVRWKAEWNRGKVIYDNIQIALKKQNWDQASKLLGELSLNNDPGWQDRLAEIRLQINTEKVAWQHFKEAEAFAKANPPESLGQAIALADPIDRKTYVWTLQAQADVVKWRNTIFSLALARLDKSDIPGASTLIGSIPKSVQLTSANVDFVRLVRGKEADTSQDFRAPSLDKAAALMLSTHLVRQIDSKSPFYDRAKTLLPRLEARLQDVLSLNWSGTLANLQQVPALQLAVEQAKAISPKRPGRLYAQTLLAQWRKELQWIEDRPVLKQARQTAKSGKLEQLRSAVILANLVKPNRALRQEAQTDIADWTYQIQVIEDRPIIADAKAIARAGRLGEAIDVASNVRPGRALYWEARNLISGWVYEIQLAEDRSILAQANGLASRGSLTRAIDTASAIYSGRPLYGEARSLISQWAAERAEIWRQREQQQYAPPSDSASDSYSKPADSSSDTPSSDKSDEPAPPQ